MSHATTTNTTGQPHKATVPLRIVYCYVRYNLLLRLRSRSLFERRFRLFVALDVAQQVDKYTEYQRAGNCRDSDFADIQCQSAYAADENYRYDK